MHIRRGHTRSIIFLATVMTVSLLGCCPDAPSWPSGKEDPVNLLNSLGVINFDDRAILKSECVRREGSKERVRCNPIYVLLIDTSMCPNLRVIAGGRGLGEHTKGGPDATMESLFAAPPVGVVVPKGIPVELPKASFVMPLLADRANRQSRVIGDPLLTAEFIRDARRPHLVVIWISVDSPSLRTDEWRSPSGK